MIHPNTRVLVEDVGYGAIGDLTAPFSLWSGNDLQNVKTTLTEPSTTFLVKLINGVEIKCSPEQGFRTRKTKVKQSETTIAKDLTNLHLVHFTENTLEFDYLNLKCYNYLSRLSSEEVGILVGLSQTVGLTSPDFPRLRREAVKEFDRILTKAKVPYTKELYFKRTDRYKYDIEDSLYSEELKEFIGFSDKVWGSKLFLRGYLKALFTFCIIGKEMFTIRAMKGSGFLKEIQQALLLFGINSSYSKGLKTSHLIIFKNNCYRFAYNIGVFNPEILFQGVDFKRFLSYKDRTTTDMRCARVYSVQQIDDERLVELSASQFMANGVILENYE